MKTLIAHSAAPIVVGALLTLCIGGCSKSGDATQDNVPPAGAAQATNPDAPIMLRGTIVSMSANQLVLASDTGKVTVNVARPFNVYARVPGDMSQVKESSFIGVTTVKQPDGSERATEIHVFPEELRGLGEGSRMMTADTTSNASRMTNGSVTASRMSNGMVTTTNGSTLVVQYPGGSQNVTVPPNTPVTELKLASKELATGDQVVLLAKKGADGSLTSDKAVSTAK